MIEITVKMLLDENSSDAKSALAALFGLPNFSSCYCAGVSAEKPDPQPEVKAEEAKPAPQPETDNSLFTVDGEVKKLKLWVVKYEKTTINTAFCINMFFLFDRTYSFCRGNKNLQSTVF